MRMPRKFAWAERKQITDNLRNYRQSTVARYYKNEHLTLLRAYRANLQKKTEPASMHRSSAFKQSNRKTEVPISAYYLSRFANKAIFTLLDMKDDFQQIKVHPDDTKCHLFLFCNT